LRKFLEAPESNKAYKEELKDEIEFGERKDEGEDEEIETKTL
jgi:hypothetical protein